MTPLEKARAVMALPVHGPCAWPIVYEHLHAGLTTHLPRLAGEEVRDVERVDMEPHPDGAIYRGFSSSAVQRLYCLVALECGARIVDIVLVVTKGETRADERLFRASGPEIGNSLLVARLLHVGIACLRGCGVEAIRNDPADDRVREIYRQMGFVNGELLDLGDLGGLTQALTFVAAAYRKFRLSLGLPP